MSMMNTTLFRLIAAYFRSLVVGGDLGKDGTIVDVKGFDPETGAIVDRKESTTVFGILADMSRSGLLVAVSTAFTETAKKWWFTRISRIRKEDGNPTAGQTALKVSRVLRMARKLTTLNQWVVIPTSPRKALDIDHGIQFFFKGDAADLAMYMSRYGMTAWTNDIIRPASLVEGTVTHFCATSPEKAFKYLNAKIRTGTSLSTMAHVIDVNNDACSRKLKAMGVPVEFTDHLIDGFGIFHVASEFVTFNNLHLGDVGQLRGNAHHEVSHPSEKLPLNCFKGTFLVADSGTMEKFWDFFNVPANKRNVNTFFTFPELAKKLNAGDYVVPNLGIHAVHSDTDTNSVKLGIQSISRALDSAHFGSTPEGIRLQANAIKVVDAIKDYTSNGKEDGLRAILGSPAQYSVELRGAVDEFVGGAPLRMVNRDQRITKAIESKISRTFGVKIPGRRDYFISPLMAWILGYKIKQGEGVISPAVDRSGLLDENGEICINRSPILLGSAAAVRIRAIDSWYFHGTAIYTGVDSTGKSINGELMDNDFDGDKMSLFKTGILNSQMTHAEYWHVVSNWMADVSSWDGNLSSLGFPTRSEIEVTEPYANGLYLGGLADFGIPVMDRIATTVSFAGGNVGSEMMSWKLKCAYQSVIKLVKHSAGEFIDVEEVIGGNDPFSSIDNTIKASELLMGAKKGRLNVDPMYDGINLLDSEVKQLPSFWQSMAAAYSPVCDAGEKLGADISDRCQYAVGGIAINPFLGFVLGIGSLRKDKYAIANGWNCPRSLSVFGHLGARLAIMSGTFKGSTQGIAGYSNAKKIANDRLRNLIAMLMQMRVAYHMRGQVNIDLDAIVAKIAGVQLPKAQLDQVWGYGRNKGIAVLVDSIRELIENNTSEDLVRIVYLHVLKGANVEGGSKYLIPFAAPAMYDLVSYTGGIVVDGVACGLKTKAVFPLDVHVDQLLADLEEDVEDCE